MRRQPALRARRAHDGSAYFGRRAGSCGLGVVAPGCVLLHRQSTAAALGAPAEERSRIKSGPLRRPRELSFSYFYHADAGLLGSISSSLGGACSTLPAIVVPLRLRLRLCAWARSHALQGLFLRAPRLIPILAPSLLPAISPYLPVRQSGPLEGLLFGLLDLRADRYRRWREVFYLSACVDRSSSPRCAMADARLYEAADALGASNVADVLHRHPARRAIRR